MLMLSTAKPLPYLRSNCTQQHRMANSSQIAGTMAVPIKAITQAKTELGSPALLEVSP